MLLTTVVYSTIFVRLYPLFCQIRLSSHNLEIETGRHNNVLLNNRICKLCKRDVEDEFHFVLVCPHFEVIRKRFIKKYYWQKPNVFKFVQLLSVHNIHDLCNLGKYVYFAFKVTLGVSPLFFPFEPEY